MHYTALSNVRSFYCAWGLAVNKNLPRKWVSEMPEKALMIELNQVNTDKYG
jgi:hypothetical protein